MRRFVRSLRWIAWLALAGALGCEGPVQTGLPPVASGCHQSSDCPAPFQCVQGACEEVTCSCDQDCPASLACLIGRCLVGARSNSCDAGSSDGGSSDAG